jgi:hypothetical protein
MERPTEEHHLVARVLRLLGDEATRDFLQSEEFRSLPQVERDLFYAADAEIDERHRRLRQEARQAEAEAAAKTR